MRRGALTIVGTHTHVAGTHTHCFVRSSERGRIAEGVRRGLDDEGDARRAPLLTNMAVNGWDLTSLEFPGRDVRNVDCERAGGRASRHVLVIGSNGAEDGCRSSNPALYVL